MISSNEGVLGHGSYTSHHFKFHEVNVILKTIARTRTLKGGGFGLTVSLRPAYMEPTQHVVVTLSSCKKIIWFSFGQLEKGNCTMLVSNVCVCVEGGVTPLSS